MSVRDALINPVSQGAMSKDGAVDDAGLDADTTADAQAYILALQGTPESGATPRHAKAGAGAAPTSTFFAQQQHFFEKNRADERRRDASIGLQAQAGDALGDGANASGGHTAGAVFTKAGVPVPPKALLAKVAKAVEGTPKFKALVSYFHNVVTPKNSEFKGLDAKAEAKRVVTQAANISKSMQNASTKKNGAKKGTTDLIDVANGMAAVFLALNASMAEDNKNKEVILKQMDICNQISKLIQGYITTLQQAQSALDAKTAGKDPSKAANATVPVQAWANVDVDTLFASTTTPGQMTLQRDSDASSFQAKAGSATLSADLSAAQGLQTLSNNNSTTQSNRYQSHDQDATQSFSLMATIIKSAGDTWSQIAKNSV